MSFDKNMSLMAHATQVIEDANKRLGVHDELCACYDCMKVVNEDNYDPQPEGDFSGASFYEDGSR